MGQSIDSLEWLNKNSLRAYPLKEDSSRFDITGTYSLVDDFVVDLVFVIDTNKDRTFYLKFLSILGALITGQIYDESDEPAATFTIDTASHTRYMAYPLVGIKTYRNSRGKIVIGELDNLLANPQGAFEFALADTVMEATTIIPDIRGVSSLSKADEDGVAFPRLRDHVLLGAGINTRVRVEADTNTLRIDAIEGEGLGPQCDCPDEFNFPDGIAFINGIPPDEAFNFNIRGIGCIEIEPIENGIRVKNTCVENCCDCEEIDDLEARVAALEAGP